MQRLESVPSGLAALLFFPMTAKGHYFKANLHDFQTVLVFSVLVGLGYFNKIP